MATQEQLEAALIKADAVGNKEDATSFANEIRRMRDTSAQPSIQEDNKPTQDLSFLDKVMSLTNLGAKVLATPALPQTSFGKGLVEAIPAIGTGMALSIPAGYAGLKDLVTGKGIEKAAQSVQDIQSMAYQPKTVEGKIVTSAIGLPTELASKALGYTGGKIGQAINGEQGRITGESLGEVIPPIAGTLLMGRQALNATKGVTINDISQKVIPDRLPIITKITEAVRDVWRAKENNDPGKVLLAEQYLKEMSKDATPAELQLTISSLERRGNPVVPESPVTSADAISRGNRELALKGQPERFGANYVALEEGLKKMPETNKALMDIQLAKEQARANVMNTGAGTEQAMTAAIDARSKASEPLYKQVDNSIAQVNASPVWNMANDLINKSPANADLVSALTKVRDSLGTESNLLKSPQHLQSAIENINILLTKAENKPKVISNRLMMLKDILEKQINKVEPAQGLATSTFAEKSIPINQMQLWDKLREKFISPTGKEAPGSFLRSLRDEQKLIKEATGFKRGSDLTDIFDSKQSSLAAKLAAEMEMELTKQRMSGEVTVPGIGKPAQGIEPHLPNMLMRETMIANFILKQLATDANVPVNIAAAKILADPKMLAGVLKQVKPQHRTQILKTLSDASFNKATAIGAMVNAQQQNSTQEKQQ